MASGEDDTTPSGAGRSPGLIPALAFALVIVFALAVALVLRQLLPATASPTVTPAASSTAALPTAAPTVMVLTPTMVAATILPATASATRPPTPSAPAATIAPTKIASSTARPSTSPVPAASPAVAQAPVVLPPAALGIPPVIYSFYDWQNTNYASTLPAAGAIGSVAVFPWNRLNTGPDQYDWSAIDSYLTQAASMTLTLQNGTVISKPVILEIIENESETPSKQIAHAAGGNVQSARFLYHDYTPDFVRRQITATLSRPIAYTLPDGSQGTLTNDGGSYLADVLATSGCMTRTVAIAPKYDNPVWQQAYKQFVAALGARYDKDPQVVAFIFGPGIDQEYGQATKDYQGCALRTQLYRTMMPEAAYLNTVVKAGPANDLADAWRAAFPTKPLYFQFTSTGKDRVETLAGEGYQPPIGLKQATLTLDSNNQWQSNGRGTWQIMDAFSTTLSIAWENAYANVGTGATALQNRYFTILAGLSTFPVFMDFNGWIKELSTDAPWLLDFTRNYLGRSITTTDEIWVGMRGTDYPTPTTGAVGYAGWNDDATYGLRVSSEAPLVRRAQLEAAPFKLPPAALDHPFALMARRTDSAKGVTGLAFAADQRWPFWKQKPLSADAGGVWYDVTVKYLDQGSDSFSLVYQDATGAAQKRTIAKGNTSNWITATVVITDAYLAGGLAGGADMILDAGSGDEVVHMLSIKGHASPPSTALLKTPAVDYSAWLGEQRAARATATAVARLPGVLPTRTINRALILPLAAPASVSPTPTPTEASVAITPPGRPTIPPVYYAFYDWENTDFTRQFPDFPAIGGQPVFGWQDLHQGPGQYNWTLIDTYLRDAAAMTVTLSNGTVVSKPIILEIVENESEVYSSQYSHDPTYANRVDPWAARIVFHDYTPAFVKQAIAAPLSRPITYETTSGQMATLTSDGGSYLVDILPGVGACITRTVGIVPKYNNPTWQTYYKQFVQALGARYNSHPQIVGVVFGPGIDEEFGQATKAFFECPTNANPYMTDASYYDAVIRAGATDDIMHAFRNAFPSKPVLLQFTGSGKDRADIAMQQGLAFPVGLKQATLTHDNNNQYQTNGVGTLQLMDRYSQTTYIAWENAYAYNGPNPQGRQIRYFTLLAGLMTFPSYEDFIGGWMIDWDLLDSGILAWNQSYLGRTITSTEDVWVALRDSDFWPPAGGGAIQYGGWHDDFTYGLHRLGTDVGITNPIIKRDSMSLAPYSVPTTTTSFYYSLIARRTDNASGNNVMAFYVDPRWGYYNRPSAAQNPTTGAWYDITLKYIDIGSDTLSFSYMATDGTTHSQTINKGNTRSWITQTVVINDAIFNHALARGADLIVNSDPQNGGVDEIIHMVDIKGHTGGVPTPTPSWSPTPKPTRTPTRPGTATTTRTPTPSGSTTPTATPGPFSEMRVAAGGPTYVDSQGNTWVADQPFDGIWGYTQGGLGGIYSSQITVTGTSDPQLYMNERWFGKPSGSYLFSVPSGQYEVELRFAEIFGRDAGKRIFDVDIEGTIVLPSLDIAANVGLNVALNRTFQVNVNDGQLSITLLPISDSAKIDALRVTRLNPPGGTATATATRTATATPTVTGSPAATWTATSTPAQSPTPTRTATRSPTVTATAPPAATATRTVTPTPPTTLDGRIDVLEQRYQNLLNLVTQLLQILRGFGGIR